MEVRAHSHSCCSSYCLMGLAKDTVWGFHGWVVVVWGRMGRERSQTGLTTLCWRCTSVNESNMNVVSGISVPADCLLNLHVRAAAGGGSMRGPTGKRLSATSFESVPDRPRRQSNVDAPRRQSNVEGMFSVPEVCT